MGRVASFCFLLCIGSVGATNSLFGIVGVYSYNQCNGAWQREAGGFHERLTNIDVNVFRFRRLAATNADEDINQASIKVYATYRSVLEQKKKSASYIDTFVNGLIAQDAAADKTTVFYFIYRDPETGEFDGLFRIQLFIEKNLVTFGRFATKPRPNQTPVGKEILYSVADFLRKKFGDKAFDIRGYTNLPRARLYRANYNFAILKTPQQTQVADKYEIGISGQEFIYIYLRHISVAYEIALNERDPERALRFLSDAEKRFHLQDYGPTQHAKKHMGMLSAIITGSGMQPWSVFEQVMRGDKNDANLDFEAIYHVRSLYDLLRFRGSPGVARRALRRYTTYLESLGFAGTDRMTYMDGLDALLKAHEGDTDGLLALRQTYGATLNQDKADFELFLTAYSKEFPSKSVTNIDCDQAFIALKMRFIDPAFRTFAKASNPFIFWFLADVYKTHDVKVSQRLTAIADGVIPAEGKDAYLNYYKLKK